MADRGFTISDELEAKGIRLRIPSFLGSKRAQLKARKVTQTRRIAEARIHVERAIQRIKKRKRREKKVEKAGIDPAAAAPSQPDRLDGSCSDHSAGSKESAS